MEVRVGVWGNVVGNEVVYMCGGPIGGSNEPACQPYSCMLNRLASEAISDPVPTSLVKVKE